MTLEKTFPFVNAGDRQFGVYPADEIPADQQHEIGQKWIDLVASDHSPYKNVWMLGCGNGASDVPVTTELENRNEAPVNFTFLDVQPTPLKEASQRFLLPRYSFGSAVRFLQKDLNWGFPERDNSVDGIFFKWAMHWVSDPQHLMRSFSKVLKPGGHAYIATLTPWDVAVSNEVYRKNIDKSVIQDRYPQAIIAEGVSKVTNEAVWSVSHTPYIDDYVATHPAAQTVTYGKLEPNISGEKTVTGFKPDYFKLTAKALNMEVLELKTERNLDFPNSFSEDDERSKSKIHVLLRKK